MSPALAEPAPAVRRESAHLARRRGLHGLPKAPPAETANDREPARPTWRRLVHEPREHDA